MNYVAYYRVSTERQGKSGLGLAAQKRKIEEFLVTAGTLIGEFCDIQSGRDDSRSELQKALLRRSFTTPRSSLHGLIGSRAASVLSPTFSSRGSAFVALRCLMPPTFNCISSQHLPRKSAG